MAANGPKKTRAAGPVFFLRVRALLRPGAFERKAVARPGPHGRFSGFAVQSRKKHGPRGPCF